MQVWVIKIVNFYIVPCLIIYGEYFFSGRVRCVLKEFDYRFLRKSVVSLPSYLYQKPKDLQKDQLEDSFKTYQKKIFLGDFTDM